MAKNETPIIVGVFQDRKQAEQAYNELYNIGFGQDYLGLAKPGDGSEGPEMLLATFEDPDGNYFQLASPMPAE